MGWDILYDPRAVVDHVVPSERGKFAYFAGRCVAEGRSKAAVTRIAGAGNALQTERHYLRKVLPLGVAGALRDAWRGPLRWNALGRAAVIPMGIGMTAWGYFADHGAIDWVGTGQTDVTGPRKGAVRGPVAVAPYAGPPNP